ncbi:DNA helicase/exodeoxyribonuclease V, gamma subunit [Arachidicoccus rhizosphaerae]|uniref:RecBCD enzyme subunit RecC n=1 Tax=Arachidicoccus rhizosphaerae TaxID=551991 RepID=A0A1H3YYT0_9BACT|nr:exodeoxyribonuclease V subunit gamma [Arachidicoccus rhizosphaerae]SEA16232.1 DNA helicase/exodeoxyribonuclease V, gamma subunit [Arachidicoccus rhizosphaerae]
MAFQLKASNSLKILAKNLCLDMQAYKGHVFRPHYIVTQTEGMNNWLGSKLAEWQGIAAGIQYLKPNDLIFKIYLLLGGKAIATMSADNLSWLLYQLMGENEFLEQFPKIADYYAVNSNGEMPSSEIDLDAAKVKRYGLAQKVADLFDQYQIYRSDMITEWNNGNHKIQELEAWQYYLWDKARNKQRDEQQIDRKAFADKNEIADYIKNALKENGESLDILQSKMPAVFIFGISLLTEFHLKIFDLLASRMQIYFYLLNPAPADYWYDDLSVKRLIFLQKLGKAAVEEQPQGNPLLHSMGKVIKDAFVMLFKNDEILNSYEPLEELWPEPDSLLHKLQRSIYENKTPQKETAFFEPTDLIDKSLSIHACYSPLREVESLYNFLIYLIDQKRESLSPRDIVVMVSDIDLYAAYIRAVFDHAPYQFSYRIADEKFTTADSISSALESLLLLEPNGFTSENIMRLLDSSYIRSHLGISQLGLIKDLLDASGIRFGIEGAHRDDSIYVSWKYGLQRIMYGICMVGDDEVGSGPDGFYPLNFVEGSSAEEVIRFVSFVEALMTMLENRQKPRSLDGWTEFIKELITQFILKEELQGGDEFDYLDMLLKDYNSSAAFLSETLSFDVFMQSFGQRILLSTREANFASGGITFCSLIPMRSIPFKVIALLGLDYDKFPRKEHALGFNLMEMEKRAGDRNVKVNDKHLFLETILSAEQYLYISYIGRSIKDNTDIPPSILVDELIDFIDTNCSAAIAHDESLAEFKKDKVIDARNVLVVKHALHHFSKFQPGGIPQYLHLKSVAENLNDIAVSHELPDNESNEISLEAFYRFLQHPIKGYLNAVAGIYYEQMDDVLKEEEIFELNGLESYQCRVDLMELSDESAWEHFRDKGVKTGRLPLKNSSRIAMNDLLETVAPVRELLLKETKGLELHQFPVSYNFKEIILKGVIDVYGEDQLILVSWSKNEFKKVLEGYIKYLLLLVSGKDVSFTLLSFHKRKAFKAKQIKSEEAKLQIELLLELYQKGHEYVLPFISGLEMKTDEYETWYDKVRAKCSGTDYKDDYLIKINELDMFTQEAFEQYKQLQALIEAPLLKLFDGFKLNN